MQLATLYLSTAVIFLVLDAIMLNLHMQPLFQRHISALMAEEIRLAPAAIFYLAYVAGVIYLVTWPAWENRLGGDFACCDHRRDGLWHL